MTVYKIDTQILKKGHLELNNLPLNIGDKIEVRISKKKIEKDLDRLIFNDHVWSEEDIEAVNEGRRIINQWKIS
jgi:hypothetical protein